MKKVFLALMVCAGLAACTSDDVVIGTSSDTGFTGGDLYLQVFISDVKDGGTRATGIGDNDANSYENGSDSEYAVSDAKFYFYDKDGVFISRASVWDDGDVNSTIDNIEYTSGTMIVLKGLTDTQLPKYMVTVLNEPSTFEDAGTYDPANTLGELESKLVDGYKNGDYFIMSTSSYTKAGTETDGSDARSAANKNYFVTEIDQSSFQAEPISSINSDDAVQVYVERLAAKVEVTTGSALTANDDGYYELDITVGGTANDDDPYKDDDDSSTYDEGIDQVYVQFQGWKLNATARQSYIMKNVNDEWDGENYWANSTWNVDKSSWNDSDRYRSYWGKGTAYGTGTFPTSNIKDGNTVSNTDSDEASSSTWLNDYLQYTSLLDTTDDPLLKISNTETTSGIYGYCCENTNVIDAAVTEGDNQSEGGTNGIKDAYSSGITSVLLKAQAYQQVTDETLGTTTYEPLGLVNYNGFYWTVDGFKDEIARTEINYDLQHAADLATEELGSLYGATIEALINYMDPELYCSKTQITAESTEISYKAFDGSFLGLVNLQNGGVGIWPNCTTAKYSDGTTVDSSLATKWTAVTGDDNVAQDDLDDYYLYLKVTDPEAWEESNASGTTSVMLPGTVITAADGNTYFYLDDGTTLQTTKTHNYSLRQFFVRALEMEADETNQYFAGEIDANGSSVTTTSTVAAPNLYNEGLMYYSIPIEHLVSGPTATSEGEEVDLVEGQYGVVRNHWYTITITGLSKLGKGISDESAVIVPDPEGTDTWLLPAVVNINSWLKVTGQEVGL